MVESVILGFMLYIFLRLDLELNNLEGLICHKTHLPQPTSPNTPNIYIYIYIYIYI